MSFVHLGYIDNHGRYARDDSSASDDGGDSQSTVFIIGSGDYLNQNPVTTQCAATSVVTVTSVPLLNNCIASSQSNNNIATTPSATNFSNLSSAHSVSALAPQNSVERLVPFRRALFFCFCLIHRTVCSFWFLFFFINSCSKLFLFHLKNTTHTHFRYYSVTINILLFSNLKYIFTFK